MNDWLLLLKFAISRPLFFFILIIICIFVPSLSIFIVMFKRNTHCHRLFFVLMLSLVAGSIQAQDRLYADEFPIGDVTLLDGPLKKARDLNIKVLLQYDNDRLLAPFLKEAGLTPKGELYLTGQDWTVMWVATI